MGLGEHPLELSTYHYRTSAAIYFHPVRCRRIASRCNEVSYKFDGLLQSSLVPMDHYEIFSQMFHFREWTLQTGGDPDQPVNGQTNGKIQDHAPVNPVILMT